MIISFLFAGNLLSAQQTLQEDQSPGTGVTTEDYKKCANKCRDTYPNDELKRTECISGCVYARAIPKADIEAPKPLNTAPAQPPKTTTPTTTTPTKTTTKKQ